MHGTADSQWIRCNDAVLSGGIGDARLRCGSFPPNSTLISPALHICGGVCVAGESHAIATRFFKSRLSHLPERWIAVIVRHRILKQRLDDSPRRRSSAWRDANAMLANLIHPMVYAPGANMPQDALDDRRVIDE